MRLIVASLGLLVTGCLAGTGNFDWYDSPPTSHAALPPAPPPPSQPLRLARRHGDGARYRRHATAWIGVAGVGRGMRISLGGEVGVAPSEGGYREDAVVTSAQADGAAVYMDPRSGTPPMVGTEMRMRFDHGNHAMSEPQVVRSSPDADPLITEIARVVFGRLRVSFPDHDVRPGDTWEAPPIRMDTRGSGGWVTITMRPRFRLDRVDEGVAVVGWSGTVESDRFCNLGPCLVGRGNVRGTSRIAIADGFEGRTDLSYEVAVRSEDAPADTPPILEIEARFADSRRRL